MVSSFEVHFTDPTGFLEELRADHGAAMVQDSMVRLSLRSGEATLGMVYADQRAVPGADRPTPNFRSRYVEASYISTRGQLVKLSAYCGVEPVAVLKLSPGSLLAMGAATALKLKETTYKLQAAFAALPGLTVRGGGLFVENGTWTADPEAAIEAPPSRPARPAAPRFTTLICSGGTASLIWQKPMIWLNRQRPDGGSCSTTSQIPRSRKGRSDGPIRSG